MWPQGPVAANQTSHLTPKVRLIVFKRSDHTPDRDKFSCGHLISYRAPEKNPELTVLTVVIRAML